MGCGNLRSNGKFTFCTFSTRIVLPSIQVYPSLNEIATFIFNFIFFHISNVCSFCFPFSHFLVSFSFFNILQLPTFVTVYPVTLVASFRPMDP
ncbi:hypothetical protein KSS87_022042, partial [Heliosperma pusillum]